MLSLLQVAQSSGLLEYAVQFVNIAGTVVLLGLLVALGAFAYRSLRGDLTWPDDDAEDENDAGVTRSDDDEWRFS
jgi:hypothetical protein